MQIDFREAGIYLPALDLWLDPQVPVARAWLSHAHSDHARGIHGNVWGTTPTLRIYAMRWPDPLGGRCANPVPWGEPWELNGARLTAYPAGHIVGAAQLLIEAAGEKVVYTGDMKLRAPLCGDTATVPRCDRLIMESTFGIPVYHFLSAEHARDRIAGFARACFADGASPVFLGYPLGRGQEIVNALTTAGIATQVHGAIAKFIPIYEEAGYSFLGWEPYSKNTPKDCAVVVTPGMRTIFEASPRDYRIAYVSGWAALSNARARSGATELIPYSDHADFEELLAIVEQSGAREVDLVHGYTEALASILCSRGLDARAPRALAARMEVDQDVE